MKRVLLSSLAAAALVAAAPLPARSAQESLPPALAEATPRSLSFMPVIGTDDETIGRVDGVVRDKRSNALELVVRTDEDKLLTIALDRVEAVDEQLRLTQDLPDSALEPRASDLDADRYAPVERDAQLAQLAAQPPAG